MFLEESTLKNKINMFRKMFRNVDTSVYCISVKGATLTESYFCLRHKIGENKSNILNCSFQN